MARTCSTSLVPMPNARAPNAPWVAVWLSPQTIVIPGWVNPNSGPITWTTPWLVSFEIVELERQTRYSSPGACRSAVCGYRDRRSARIGRWWAHCGRPCRDGSTPGVCELFVRPDRSPSNAWGLVTSWTRLQVDVENGLACPVRACTTWSIPDLLEHRSRSSAGSVVHRVGAFYEYATGPPEEMENRVEGSLIVAAEVADGGG